MPPSPFDRAGVHAHVGRCAHCGAARWGSSRRELARLQRGVLRDGAATCCHSFWGLGKTRPQSCEGASPHAPRRGLQRRLTCMALPPPTPWCGGIYSNVFAYCGLMTDTLDPAFKRFSYHPYGDARTSCHGGLRGRLFHR